MAEQRKKYLKRSKHNKALQKVVESILNGTIEALDVIPIVGHNGLYRARVGDLRILFSESPQGYTIEYIGPRGDIYRQL